MPASLRRQSGNERSDRPIAVRSSRTSFDHQQNDSSQEQEKARKPEHGIAGFIFALPVVRLRYRGGFCRLER